MTQPLTNNLFLSQPIRHHSVSPPLLIAPSDVDGRYDNNPEEKPNEESIAWKWEIDASLIPTLNRYYMLEPTSITLKQIPVSILHSRMTDFLRLQSISYDYDATSVRLNCMTSNMLKFVVQFWRVNRGPNEDYLEDPNQALTVELQRRQGSVVEMQTIRRKMFKTLITGEQTIPDNENIRQLTLPETIVAEVNAGYDHDKGLADAVEIALRLLESQCIDQRCLGLESMQMLTNPSIVTPRDALIVSKALIFHEGPFGARLQTALGRYFGSARLDGVVDEQEEAMGHSIALSLLGNALQQVSEKNTLGGERAVIANSSFWNHVCADLSRNVEMAIRKPHEAAKSAMCIRLLNSLDGDAVGTAKQILKVRGPAWRSCLAQAHQFGRHCHLSLERESMKLLRLDTAH